MVTIFGLGYVGLTLALFFSKNGVRVIGYDISEEKISSLVDKKSYVVEEGINDILSEVIDCDLFEPRLLNEKTISAETGLAFVTIGTTLHNGSIAISESRLIELCSLIDVSGFDTIVLRSTVAIGTCKKISNQLLNTKIVFAPERTLEGVAMEELQHLPQILGGEISPNRQKVEDLFKKLQVKVVTTDIWEEAELAKLTCNTYRDYYFAFANAITDIANNQSIDGNNVLQLSSEGYDRMPYILPGPVSGPCLTKDTHILEQSTSCDIAGAKLLVSARSINNSVIEKIVTQISELAKAKKVAFWGTSFKSNPDTSDTRESHTLSIIENLVLNGFDVEVYDPYIDIEGLEMVEKLMVKKPSFEPDRVVVFGCWPKWIQELTVSNMASQNNFSNLIKYWCYPIKESYKFENSYRYS